MTKNYPNGKVPAHALRSIYGVKLRWGARTDLVIAIKAAKKVSVTLRPALPLGGYRSLSQQAALKAHPGQHGSNLKSSQIAAPGSSTHGDGKKVDIASGNAWFEAHCHTYHFKKTSPAGEDNHYEHIAH